MPLPGRLRKQTEQENTAPFRGKRNTRGKPFEEGREKKRKTHFAY